MRGAAPPFPILRRRTTTPPLLYREPTPTTTPPPSPSPSNSDFARAHRSRSDAQPHRRLDVTTVSKLDEPKQLCAEPPLQLWNRNECALYVCYYMEKILKKEAIPDKVRTEEFQVFKAHVMRTILTMKDK